MRSALRAPLAHTVPTRTASTPPLARPRAPLSPAAAATWVSDSNCREGQVRVRNVRTQYNYTGSE